LKILITGGTGNLGSRLLVPLIRRGDALVLYDVCERPHVASPEFKEAKLIQGDLANRDTLLQAVRSDGIESIFHLGAVLSSAAEEHPDEAWRANMDGMSNVLEVARQAQVQHFVFTSTIATYGERVPDPLPADAPQWPTSLYGVTKVAGERLGVYYHHRFGVDFRVVRLPAVVAPRGATGGVSSYCSAVFEESVRKGRYEFYVNPTTSIPIVYIADVVQGLLALHDVPSENLTRRVYNIAGIHPSAKDLAAAIQKRLPHAEFSYKPDPMRIPILESWPHQIDDSDAKRDWGWQPLWDLDGMTGAVIEELQRESKS
jgi:nucleoside-diphosphate-sugar epimerase